MGVIKRLFGIEEKRDDEVQITPELDSALLRAFIDSEVVNRNIAMEIPTIASAVNLISSMVANINYKLYKYDEKKRLTEVEDRRVNILNKSTGDLLNGYEMKRAFVQDYLLNGNGYIYIEKLRNEVISLRYVDEINVSVTKNCDPIFKKALFIINGGQYEPYEFITITRNSTDGVTGKGICQENKLVTRLINNMLKMLNNNVSAGGAKKGFLKVANRSLNKESFEKLKEDFKKLYSNESYRVIALNEGVEFEDATESSTDMQLQELYSGIGEDVGEILQVPENIKNNKANDEEFRNWFKVCILPIANEIVASLNENLLLESEKNDYFWRADTSEIENGDLKHQLEAYKLALDSNAMQLDEVREKIGLPPRGFNYIKIGLDSVLIDPDKNIIYTPNTNAIQNMNDINKQIGETNNKLKGDES